MSGSMDPSSALHEYLHHLQATMSELQAMFNDLHRRRTTNPDGSRHSIERLPHYADK